MKFKAYSEIENSYRQKYIDKILECGLNTGDDWIVLEKAHGSNIQLASDGTSVKFGKRTSFLEEGTSFFNWQFVYDKYASRVLDIFTEIKALYPNTTQIMLYGELIGGTYPHPNVEKAINSAKIQKGVYYCPHNDIIIFDIYKIENNEEKGLWLPYTLVIDLCYDYEILYFEPLFIGTLDEALKYPNLFETTIPSYFELPPIKDNTCEGVVIKPNISKCFPTGERIIIKNKNSKFSEKSTTSEASDKSIPKDVQLSEIALSHISSIRQFINENRLRNVLSKFGPITDKDFGSLLSEFMGDIITDYIKENPSYKDLLMAERNRISKIIIKEAAAIIRNNFINIIDGNF